MTSLLQTPPASRLQLCAESFLGPDARNGLKLKTRNVLDY